MFKQFQIQIQIKDFFSGIFIVMNISIKLHYEHSNTACYQLSCFNTKQYLGATSTVVCRITEGCNDELLPFFY